jgi:SAM-dependent methyltransferase
MKPPYLVGKMRPAMRRALLAVGVDSYLKSDERRELETVILPWFSEREEFGRVLFVGCKWYTRGYRRFFEGKDYWTLELDPAGRRFGARLHITDSIENLRAHFREGSLDLIVVNGVFGWGLNAKDAVENAFAACFDCLRDGGVLVLGWNDVPRRRPCRPEEIESLARFEPFAFPPLAASRHLTTTRNRHVFDFHRKPDGL